MTEAQLSILVSFIALGLSAIALGWNIYRDVALRAIVIVSADKVSAIQGKIREGPFLLVESGKQGAGTRHLAVYRFSSLALAFTIDQVRRALEAFG